MTLFSLWAVLGVLALAAWVYLLRAHDGFWRVDQWLGPVPARGRAWPGVVAIVPARDEAETVGRCLASLAAQDYPGPLSILLVDDDSTDGTGERARSALGAFPASRTGRVIEAPALAEGWTGKLNALDAGIREAARIAPDAPYLWFTDADILHGPNTLMRLVARAEAGRDQVSVMVRLHCESFWERLLIPAFVFFFQMLYPFAAVNAAPSRVGGAAGGCLLVRRSALEAAGGVAAIRSALIDDCALAELLRRRGYRLWLGHADSSWSLRRYDGLGDIWGMIARTAYTQLGYSPIFLLGTLLGMIVVFAAPPLLVLGIPLHDSFAAGLAGGAAWFLMAVAYRSTLSLYGLKPIWSLALPIAGALYTVMTLDSALRHWRGQGGRWKARAYGQGR